MHCNSARWWLATIDKFFSISRLPLLHLPQFSLPLPWLLLFSFRTEYCNTPLNGPFQQARYCVFLSFRRTAPTCRLLLSRAYGTNGVTLHDCGLKIHGKEVAWTSRASRHANGLKEIHRLIGKTNSTLIALPRLQFDMNVQFSCFACAFAYHGRLDLGTKMMCRTSTHLRVSRGPSHGNWTTMPQAQDHLAAS